jgi:hypothetical protein
MMNASVCSIGAIWPSLTARSRKRSGGASLPSPHLPGPAAVVLDLVLRVERLEQEPPSLIGERQQLRDAAVQYVEKRITQRGPQDEQCKHHLQPEAPQHDSQADAAAVVGQQPCDPKQHGHADQSLEATHAESPLIIERRA